MKTVLILLLFATQSLSSAANLCDDKPAHAAFRKNFSTATDVSWENGCPFQRVSFSLGNQVMEAVYTSDGELVSLLRNISSDHLPLLPGLEARKILKEYWITALTEVVTPSDQYYIMVVQNGEKELVLKTNDQRRWKVIADHNK